MAQKIADTIKAQAKELGVSATQLLKFFREGGELKSTNDEPEEETKEE